VEGDDVLEAHHMTVGDDRHQGADPDLEVVQDMADVLEIVQNMGLVLNLALTLLPNLMEMDAQCLDPGPGPGLDPMTEIKSENLKKTQDSLLWKKILT